MEMSGKLDATPWVIRVMDEVVVVMVVVVVVVVVVVPTWVFPKIGGKPPKLIENKGKPYKN